MKYEEYNAISPNLDLQSSFNNHVHVHMFSDTELQVFEQQQCVS